jgi:putative ABC transport system permease protein
MTVRQASWNAIDRRGWSVAIVLTVALGVALAIAIIAAIQGTQDEVKGLLDIGIPLPPQIDSGRIFDALDQARFGLTTFAFGVTAVVVASVTWMSISRRRRDIGISLRQGLYVWEVLLELLIESALLCFLGGILGIAIGRVLCAQSVKVMPLIPMRPETGDILLVFPVTAGLSFLATLMVALVFVFRSTAVTSRPAL